MTLAIFDLDNTLLSDDSDHLWGCFLAQQGIVDGRSHQRENDRFYEEYKSGTLDIFAYQRFILAPLVDREPATLEAWHRRYMTEMIAPIILPAGRTLVEWHRSQGHTLLIITATNRFITAPIAAALGVDALLATEPEVVQGRYTGNIVGIPTFQQGKVERLEQWLRETSHNLAGAWFYSDSHNDLPLLELVAHPVAVDPDETLRSHAETLGWDIVTLRRGERPQPLARDEGRGTKYEEGY